MPKCINILLDKRKVPLYGSLFFLYVFSLQIEQELNLYFSSSSAATRIINDILYFQLIFNVFFIFNYLLVTFLSIRYDLVLLYVTGIFQK